MIFTSFVSSLVATTAALGVVPQDSPAQSAQAQIDELSRRIDLLSAELETLGFDESLVAAMDSLRTRGISPTASRVYDSDGSVSIGGYGEAFYENQAGGNGDNSDSLRTVLYVGKRLGENFVFNSEIEFEHGGTSGGGSASAEFAYVDWLMKPSLNLRAGLLLVPMGIVNELHEPTTFLPVGRPRVEQRIMPSTWRENGVGAYGDVGGFSYTAYLVNGLDASGFSDAGLRGGRQKGSRALTEDVAFVLSVDYNEQPGLVIGGSAYFGDSGQGQAALGDAETTIGEVHVDYRREGWRARALYAMAKLDDVETLNAGLGLTGADSVGEELNGGYVEVGYDVMSVLDSESRQSLLPYLRYEQFDTQAAVPTAFASNPSNDETIVTLGVAYQPNSQVIFKAEYEDFDEGRDQWNLSVGYVF